MGKELENMTSEAYTFDGMSLLSLLESFSLTWYQRPTLLSKIWSHHPSPITKQKNMSSGLKPSKAALRPWKVPSTWCPWATPNGKTQGSTSKKWCTKGLWGLKVVQELIPLTLVHPKSVRITVPSTFKTCWCVFFGPTAQQTLYKHVLAASPCQSSPLNSNRLRNFHRSRDAGMHHMLPMFRPPCWWGIPRWSPN